MADANERTKERNGGPSHSRWKIEQNSLPVWLSCPDFACRLQHGQIDVLGRSNGGRGGMFNILTQMAREADTFYSETRFALE